MGQPQKNGVKVFELLILEGMQAGLSWLTVLKKRDALRDAFAQFNPVKLSQFNDKDVRRLLSNAAIIRHEKKIKAVIHNAKVFLAMQKQSIDLAQWCWRWVNHQPILNKFNVLKISQHKLFIKTNIQRTEKTSFKFVGPTTVLLLCKVLHGE